MQSPNSSQHPKPSLSLFLPRGNPGVGIVGISDITRGLIDGSVFAGTISPPGSFSLGIKGGEFKNSHATFFDIGKNLKSSGLEMWLFHTRGSWIPSFPEKKAGKGNGNGFLLSIVRGIFQFSRFGSGR